MEKIEKEWQDNNDVNSIVDILYEYLRHWKWFILSIGVFLLLGIAVILTTQKQYKSSISVLLNENKNSGNSTGNLSLDEFGLLSTTNNLDNEIAIFSSPDLMKGVVDTLNLQSRYFIHNNLTTIEKYNDFPFYANYKGKEESYKEFDFSITKNGKDYLIDGKYIAFDENEIKISKKTQHFPISLILKDSISRVDIRLTGKPLQESEKYYINISNTMSTVGYLCSNLNITPTTKTSSTLNINLLINNTQKGSVILRELVKQYNELNVRVNNEIAYNTAIFINDRLREISAELGDVEKDVVDYKQRYNIADLTSEAQLSIQQTGQNKEKLMEIETQLNVISLVDRFVNDPNNRFKIIPNLEISDPTLSSVITQYNSKILSSDALLKSTGEENPMRMRVLEELNNMRASISNSLSNVKQAYTISKQDLLRLSSSTQSRIQSIPQQERGLLERVRQQQVKESLFLFLMQKREETNMSIASTYDKARIIASPQINIAPIAPKARIIILAALLIGLLLPIIIIYLTNLFATQIKNRAELERLSIASVIGQIAKNRTKEQIVIRQNQNTGIAEMFRSLRNNLNFILKNENHQIIMVTSTIAGEGKSFVSSNLAMSYALSGKKTLLIGADIRRPMLKNYFDVNIKKGITDFLISPDMHWNDFIKQSNIDQNLYIMVAGTIPPNPNELLMSPKMEILLSKIKMEYDIVIIDTAPVGLVSDSYLINKYADTTLYVVRENVTPKAVINFINTQKEENKLHNMYLLLNGTSLDNHYGYRYGYGKGYGYESN